MNHSFKVEVEVTPFDEKLCGSCDCVIEKGGGAYLCGISQFRVKCHFPPFLHRDGLERLIRLPTCIEAEKASRELQTTTR